MLLLIEDNLIDERLTLRAFKENKVPHEIIVVRDGEEALDFLHAKGKHQGRDTTKLPTLIFLDLKIPKVNGLEVLKNIRSQEGFHLLPVIILTSSIEERDLIQSYTLGANSYIRKQVDFEQFLSTVKQVCSYWLDLNQGPPLQHMKRA